MDSILDIDSKVTLTFVLLRSHELDAHDLIGVWNALLKLKIPCAFDGQISEFLQLRGNTCWLSAQANCIQHEIEIPGATRPGQEEFHCLCSSQHEVVCGGSES